MTGRRLSIFNLAGALPESAGDGRSATFATLAAVCRAGADVTYAFPAPRGYEPDPDFEGKLSATCEGRVRFLPLRSPRGAGGLAAYGRDGIGNLAAASAWALRLAGVRSRLGKREVLLRVLYTSRDAARRLEGPLLAAARERRFDVAQVDYPWVARLGARLRDDLPAVYVCHELQSDLLAQSGIVAEPVLAALKRAESSTLRAYDRVVTLSDADRDYVREALGVAGAETSALAVDTRALLAPTLLTAAAATPRFTFLGSAAHPPNVDAVSWLCREIFPRLRSRIPGSRLSILGRYPDSLVSRFEAPDLRFEGFVEDLGPALRDSIFLCPVRFASGIRIKILEAVLRGATVVSTRRGMSGLPFEPENEYLPAEDPESFALQCARLADDGRMRDLLCRAAQRRLLSTFSPEAVAERRLGILARAMSAHASPGRA